MNYREIIQSQDSDRNLIHYLLRYFDPRHRYPDTLIQNHQSYFQILALASEVLDIRQRQGWFNTIKNSDGLSRMTSLSRDEILNFLYYASDIYPEPERKQASEIINNIRKTEPDNYPGSLFHILRPDLDRIGVILNDGNDNNLGNIIFIGISCPISDQAVSDSGCINVYINDKNYDSPAPSQPLPKDDNLLQAYNVLARDVSRHYVHQNILPSIPHALRLIGNEIIRHIL